MKRQRPPTPFESRVYRICAKIPRGHVSTYKALAHALDTKAYRAVGQALNKSPGMPTVPCHRIVAADGSIGGFARGPAAKAKLLQKEGVLVRNGKVVDFKTLFWPVPF